LLSGPGRLDFELLEDAPLGGGEPVERDPVGGVGDAEALEGGEDVAAGGRPGAAFGQEPGELLVAEAFAQFGFDQAEDEQREPDDCDERLDAVVVVEEDRAHGSPPRNFVGE
jgi:hypothetical protein